MTRRKRRPELTTGPTAAELAAAIPDAAAVFDATGELTGWDASAAHAYLSAHGISSPCDNDCAARSHIDPW